MELHDIQGLDSVSWFPLAPGWWIVIGSLVSVFSVIGLLFFLKKRQQSKNNWQLTAQQAWQTLQSNLISDRERLQRLSHLLRWVAIQRYGRSSCASLSGQDWLYWLTEHDPKGFDWQQHGKLLIESNYMPANVEIETEKLQKLFGAVKHWMYSHSHSKFK